MFFRGSRYRDLPDEVTVDVEGRRLPSRSLRLLPEVSGQFRHSIDATDRLDHLAFKYYKQPRKWWQLCDANPEFLSPLEMLGKTPIETHYIPMCYQPPAKPRTNGCDAANPPWGVLLADLRKMLGVIDASLADDESGVVVVHNRLNVDAETLARAIEEHLGFTTEQPRSLGRLAKKIVIPPDVVI